MQRQPSNIKSRVLPALVLCLALFAVYLANFRLVRIDDSVPARLLPFSLLINHSLYLDHWVEPYMPSARGPFGVYFVERYHGHWISAYPIITPLVVAPLYVIPARWLTHLPPSLRYQPAIRVSLIDVMEKLSASLIAVLSALLLYLAVSKLASVRTSLIVCLAYGLASTTWVISSQALWKQGMGELAFAFLLWALVRNPDSGLYPVYVGLALAVAAANAPPDGVMIFPFLIYFARQPVKRLARFVAPLAAIGIPVLLYNVHFFGTPLMGYPAYAAATSHPAGSFLRTPFFVAVAGLLASPSRGLLIYVPWTAFAFWGAVRIWKDRDFDWAPYLIAGMALIFFGYAKFSGWWGGWCFGPRYLTNLMPFFAFFLIPVWPRIERKKLFRVAFVLCFAFAVWVEVVGAFFYPNGNWDSVPVAVDRAPERLWNWRDNQILRSWSAGPANFLLYDDVKLLLQVHAFERHIHPHPEASRRSGGCAAGLSVNAAVSSSPREGMRHPGEGEQRDGYEGNQETGDKARRAISELNDVRSRAQFNSLE